MFDGWQDYQSKGTRHISIVSAKGSSSPALNQISVVAPGGTSKAKTRAIKDAASIVDDQMASVVGLVKTSKKRRGKRRGGKRKGKRRGKRKAGVRRGRVQKRGSQKVTITKGRVRVKLASGKTKSVSAAQVVRKIPVVSIVKVVASIRKKGGGKRKRRKN